MSKYTLGIQHLALIDRKGTRSSTAICGKPLRSHRDFLAVFESEAISASHCGANICDDCSRYVNQSPLYQALDAARRASFISDPD